jgi:hypothetical protein
LSTGNSPAGSGCGAGPPGKMTRLRRPVDKTPDAERWMQPKVEWLTGRPDGETVPRILRSTTAIRRTHRTYLQFWGTGSEISN